MNALTLLVALAATPVTLTSTEAVNVPPEGVHAVLAVCGDAYRAASGLPVVVSQQAPMPTDGQTAGERIELRFIGLDGNPQRVIVHATRVGTAGETLATARLDLVGLSDAQSVCTRLAVALATQQPVEETQTRQTVTVAEATKKVRRTSMAKSFGVRTGFAGVFASGVELSPMGTIGFDARLEADMWFVELGASLLLSAPNPNLPSSSYGGIALEVGADRYLMEGDFAPYVGLGVQPRLVFSGSFFNLVPFAQVGVTTSRKTGVRFNIDARVAQNLLPPVTASGAGTVLPTELSLNIGVGF